MYLGLADHPRYGGTYIPARGVGGGGVYHPLVFIKLLLLYCMQCIRAIVTNSIPSLPSSLSLLYYYLLSYREGYTFLFFMSSAAFLMPCRSLALFLSHCTIEFKHLCLTIFTMVCPLCSVLLGQQAIAHNTIVLGHSSLSPVAP